MSEKYFLYKEQKGNPFAFKITACMVHKVAGGGGRIGGGRGSAMGRCGGGGGTRGGVDRGGE